MRPHSRPFSLKELKIELTYRCELNCIHCSSDARPSNSLELARDDCLRILADAAKMGTQDVAFSGGEPLLWPHVFDAVMAAVTQGQRVALYTSGHVDNFGQRSRRLRDLGLSRLIFSVFGASATTHE